MKVLKSKQKLQDARSASAKRLCIGQDDVPDTTGYLA